MGLISSLGKRPSRLHMLDDGDEVFFDELAGVVADEPLVIVEQRVELDEVDAFEFECHAVSL